MRTVTFLNAAYLLDKEVRQWVKNHLVTCDVNTLVRRQGFVLVPNITRNELHTFAIGSEREVVYCERTSSSEPFDSFKERLKNHLTSDFPRLLECEIFAVWMTERDRSLVKYFPEYAIVERM